MYSRTYLPSARSSGHMDSRFPCDVDSGSQRPWSFPRSCSPGSVLLAGCCDELSSGKDFPSTGTIPILLFDGDACDPLEPDSASLSPPFGIANNTRHEEAVDSAAGYQVSLNRSFHELGLAESLPVRGSSGERPGSNLGRNGGNLFNDSHRLLHLPVDPIDLEPSGSVDDRKYDGRGRDLSVFFDAGSSLSSPSNCCRSPSTSSSRSSFLSYSSQPSALHTSDTRRTCYGSCSASPAAIKKTQLIAATKKHRQNFALETCDPQIGQPSNSIILYDCVERLHIPFTSNHDYDDRLRHQQQDACAIHSSTCSSAEVDIDFPPRNRTMNNGLPPIEPSSSSSSTSSDLPRHLSWLQGTTISLCIDQEGFRTVFPTFKPVGYTKPPLLPIPSPRGGKQKLLAGGINGNSIKQYWEVMDQASIDPDLAMNIDAGMAEFVPLKRESFVFNHSTLDPPPSIRRLNVNEDESKDYLSQFAYLGIKSNGGTQIYAVRGSETRRGTGGEDMTGRSGGSCPIKLEWRFEYTVEDKRKADGTKAGGGEKLLTPLRFSCSPGLLHPRQARKVTVLSVWKKTIQPRIIAGRLEPLSITSPASPGHQTHNLASPLSSPTSPKGVGVGALRFASPSKLWGKRAKPSFYQLDKGSDGSEEELIPSENSANRRRRRRSTSAYAPRDMEWPLQRWSKDRGQSADAVWQTNREVRPATAGADGSRGRNRAQSFGRGPGATSEGENERGLTRSQGGLSTTRYGYPRRPRTAR